MTVTLVDSMGDDLSIVNSARVSYGKHSTEMTDADRGLLSYLIREHHGTPFEMVVFSFRVECSIAVAREWFRHRIGSFNEISTRYVEMAPDFYIPELGDVRAQVGKPGHYRFITMEQDLAAQVRNRMTLSYERSYAAYKDLLGHGVAKELARNVLPLGLNTAFIWTVNLRSLSNFLSLRAAPNALREIQYEAAEVEEWVKTVVPVTHAAWVENGRQSL